MIKYPKGKQDFRSIREAGMVYIDKTQYIEKLIEDDCIFFLSRPRRFGKSLWLSTLENFFKGRRYLFKGLAVDSYDWEWVEYPVIRLDFTGMDYAKGENLELKIGDMLADHENLYNLESSPTDCALRFKRLIGNLHRKFGRKVVVLVDEYEKPVIDLYAYPEEAKRNREILRGFYGVLKAYEGWLQFVFLTGVSKFAQMSVFSGLNNLWDISLSDKYAAICGITQDELRGNLAEGIKDLAVKESTNFEGALAMLKANYDGYHFSAESPDIYNPFSLINALADGAVANYWFRSGTPTLLVNVLMESDFDITEMQGVTATDDDLMGIDTRFHDPVPLFYQTGYLTIKRYDKEFREYTLGFPNREVEDAFNKFLLPNYINKNERETKTLLNQMIRALRDGEAEAFVTTLIGFISGVSYELIKKAEAERHFHNVIYLLCNLMLPYMVKVEERTSKGKIDMLIKTDRYLYLLEFKVDASAEKALSQIREKEYWKPYISSGQNIYLIGMNFSKSERDIDIDYKIEQL